MVCLGNICRSPLAQGILEDICRQKYLNWEIDSCGTSGHHHGEPPDPRSIHIARKNGLDITTQRARPFRSYDLEYYDYILVMDRQNLRDVLRHAQNQEEKGKIKMIMEFVRPGSPDNVPDPYYDNDGFEQVFDMLHQACLKFTEHVTLSSKNTSHA